MAGAGGTAGHLTLLGAMAAHVVAAAGLNAVRAAQGVRMAGLPWIPGLQDL